MKTPLKVITAKQNTGRQSMTHSCSEHGNSSSFPVVRKLTTLCGGMVMIDAETSYETQLAWSTRGAKAGRENP